MQQWWPAVVASAVSGGAIALVYFLIRRMVIDIKEDTSAKMDSVLGRVDDKIVKVWQTIDQIRADYMAKDTHDLICGKERLEIEKIFSGCLKKFEDNIFSHMRKNREEIESRVKSQVKEALADAIKKTSGGA